MVGTNDEKILILHPENLSINLGTVIFFQFNKYFIFLVFEKN